MELICVNEPVVNRRAVIPRQSLWLWLKDSRLRHNIVHR